VSTASAIYTGSVRHRRRAPVLHELRAPLFMMYLDLEELPRLFDHRWLWSARHPALAWFRRADYLGDPQVPLADAVRDLVAEQTGKRSAGPVRVLTHLRYFGYSINPVSFFYCFDADGEHVEAVVASVTNTPWGDRHNYVMTVGEREDHGTVSILRDRMAKELHVSPFMGLDHTYDWRLTEPGPSLLVHIESSREGETVFDATLSLKRRPITARSLAGALARHPAMTMSVAARIYGHAVALRLKGAPTFPHPSPAPTSAVHDPKEAWSA
jgi:DUF1365 family protein